MGGGFLQKKVRKKERKKRNLIIPAADGQLGKSNPGGSDMDSGHSPDIKCASLAYPNS